MAPKRSRPDDESQDAKTERKKPRTGFRVGPDNLPDGAWKRKVTKIKQDLIHKAKVKKAYAKVKAAEEQKTQKPASATAESEEPTEGQIHPERQARLEADGEEAGEEEADEDGDQTGSARPPRRGQRRPAYYEKALAKAEQRKAEAEARTQEIERRNAERSRKQAERERFRRAMAKARTPGRDGQRKLGRESGLLLEKVKRMVGEQK